MFWRRSQGSGEPAGPAGPAKEGYAAWEAKLWPEAGRLLAVAAQGVNDRREAAVLWFDAALAYKFALDWQKAYELGKKAASLVPRGKQDPAFWNLGIAATVVRDWETARDSWAGYGIELPPGEGEINEDLGWTCVRIDTELGQEVVWAQRLCPTRAKVTSVPFHPSRRFGEVVLHDGVPNGERVVDGSHFPVFDELMPFAPAADPTLSVHVSSAGGDDTKALAILFEDNDFGAEIVASRVNLCKCCSEGMITQERTFGDGSLQVLLGGVALDPARRLLDRWRDAAPDNRSWTNLHVLAGES